ncbi:MAG TPA: hypothetical protein VIM48_02750 [Chthoniobacterales bacterium]
MAQRERTLEKMLRKLMVAMLASLDGNQEETRREYLSGGVI